MKNRILSILILIILLFSSCSKMFDINPPTELKEEEIFSKEIGFYHALMGIYIKSNDTDLYGRTLTYSFIDIIANMYNISPASSYSDFQNLDYENASIISIIDKIWNKSYYLIANTNNILKNLEGKESLFSNEYSSNFDVLKAELLAFRAFYHFDLLRLFGPMPSMGMNQMSIPYVDKVSITPFPKLKMGEFLDKVITDLKEAHELLKLNDPLFSPSPTDYSGSSVLYYISSDNGFRRDRNFKLNYYVVTGLLSRAYLYKGDMTNAYKYAKIVEQSNFRVYSTINTYHYLNDILGSLWLGSATNKLYTDAVFSDAAENNKLIINNDARVKLYESQLYQTIDVRNIKNFGNKDNNVEIYPIKYYNSTFGYPFIKRSEIDLILAETAEANGDDPYYYLNKLRASRGLEQFPLSPENSIFENEITKEYCKEFIAEGQLFYYYKRKGFTSYTGINGRIITDMGPSKYIFPIPDSELTYGNN
ncbi:MAG: hypothetical protein CVU13_10370 [Bacteroidetes bacterium HGW-Bacteroidetes-8]|nr:MAG: hypothetical protein CVU13_10370 [Bacteroidetes bacterium HGW-Bacteroidetes-8]